MPVVSQQGQRSINAEKARHDRVVLEKDLFGTWSLIACRGALDSRRGGRHESSLKRTFGEMIVSGPNSYAAWGLEQAAEAYRELAELVAPVYRGTAGRRSTS